MFGLFFWQVFNYVFLKAGENVSIKYIAANKIAFLIEVQL